MDLDRARRAHRLPRDADKAAKRLADAAFVLGVVCGLMAAIVIDLGLRDGLFAAWLRGG